MANDPLVTYLDSIDKRLLDYLDEDGELSAVATQRLRSHISELLAGTMTTAALTAAWPDWFDLVSAFVVTYGSLELEDLEVESGFARETEWDSEGPPSGLTRGYLLTLELELDVFSESRARDRG
jgi:hypothetical protein